MNKLAVLLLLVCTNAFADILFVDINQSTSEVTAARKEAARRGERLVVVPPENSTAPIEEDLRTAMRAHTKSGRTFSTLIVSGHYSQQRFYGKNRGRDLEITYTRLNGVLRDPQFADIRKSIRSVLLWGCYTARPRAIADWKALLPRTQLLAGFNFAAPPSTALSSPVLMRNVLRISEDHLTDRQLIKRVQGLLNFTEGREEPYNFFGNTNLALVVRGCYITSNMGRLAEDELTECPTSLVARLTKRRVRSFDPYKRGDLADEALRRRARSSGEEGLYRFKMDQLQYGNCFSSFPLLLPSREEINALCERWDCD